MRVDLHCHSRASDGALEPASLLALLVSEGVNLAAITDHDTLGGWDALGAAARAGAPLRLVPGIEFSASHDAAEVHVVGLGFDPGHATIREAVAAQAARRTERARAIGARLEALGIPGALEAAAAHAGGGVPGRPHFARVLVDGGRVRDEEEAFDRYLGRGRPAAVAFDWPGVDAAIGWIHAAGGLAVLAHPLAYPQSRTRSRLRRLLGGFRDAGGDAAEVAMAGLAPDRIVALGREVDGLGLAASAGSDFHAPGQPWRLPGRVPPLPPGVRAVWEAWA